MTKALMRGGRDHFGWGVAEYQRADLYDALNINTKVSGQWKKKAPDFEAYPRPKSKSKVAKKKRASVMDVYAAIASRG